MFTHHTLEKRIVNVAVTGEFLGTLPSPLSGSIVLHTKTQYQQDRYVESARRHESPVIEPIGSISRVTSSLSFFEVLALLEMVGHPPLGEPIKLASCVWE